MVESCVDKKFPEGLSYFQRCWNYLLRLLMAPRRILLRIDKASLLETFGSLKISNFTRFLCDVLSPLVPNDYSCKNTFSFVSQINNANFSKRFLVSYNVTSLFTNISLQETIDIAKNLIFNHNPNLIINRKEFKRFFLFATSDIHFIFNSKFCNQIDGVAMRSPLAPVLANIFIGFHESKRLNEYNLNKPKFYLRYVDDILAAFDNKQDSLIFLNYLNNSHPNIKFIIEQQIHHSIVFLDVFISEINNQNLTLEIYHKSTHTGLLLNFKSFTSFSYKIGLMRYLIDRSFKTCNTVIAAPFKMT